MKKLLSAILFAACALGAHADQRPPFPVDQCHVFTPYGAITSNHPLDATLICRQGYFTLHDNVAKIPVWTIWGVSPKHVNGCVPRSNRFAADASLPADKRSTPQDYAGSGYDQGHIANDSHQSWDPQVELESFLMSNMAPQLPGLNRATWKLLETATGSWVYNLQQTFLVYAGPIYDVTKDKKIGKDNVDVPAAFYKIAIDTVTHEYAGWFFPHREGLGTDLTKLRMPLAKISALTNLTFPVPGDGKELDVGKEWKIDYGALTKAKRAACGTTASTD
jgi:endonuclease G, mitochondrial